MHSQFTTGVVKVLIATALWGIGYPVWNVLSRAVHSPLALTSVSFFIAAVVMFFVFRLNVRELIAKFRANAVLLLLLGFSAGAFGTGLIFFALSQIDTGIAAMLEKLQPIFTIITARIFLREQIAVTKVPYMILAIIFSMMIALPDPRAIDLDALNIAGIMAAVGSSLFFGVNTVICKVLVNGDLRPRELAFFRMFFGSVLIFPYFVFRPQALLAFSSFSYEMWGLLLGAVIISLVLAFEFFFEGLQHIPASLATFLELLTPLVALILGLLFLGESITITQALTVPLFISCIYQISKERKRRVPAMDI